MVNLGDAETTMAPTRLKNGIRIPFFAGEVIIAQIKAQVNKKFEIQTGNFALDCLSVKKVLQFLKNRAALCAGTEQNMKIMAIDLGDARTGVAISDALGMLTGSTSVIESWNKEKTAQMVAETYKKSGAERLVMGFPRNMDGSEGPRADLYREFAAKLEELLGEKVVLWDERRTTIEAHQILSDKIWCASIVVRRSSHKTIFSPRSSSNLAANSR